MQIPANYTIKWAENTDSTSAELHRQLESLPDKYVLAARHQSSGRGQGGHKWHSGEGLNLTFSILIKYGGNHRMEAGAQQSLTMAASLAVCDILNTNGINASIKKPNDIYVNGRKICGMLIENGIRGGQMCWSIIGFGINVNETEFPADLPNPVSIRQITGKNTDIKKCLEDFLRHFDVRFDAIWTDYDSLKNQYLGKLL